MPHNRPHRAIVRSRARRSASAVVLLVTVGVVAALALTPRASAAPARPACTRHALWKGLSRGSARVRHARIVRPFGCDGTWAYAAVETRRFELTSLFRARGGKWVTVKRERPCTRREVPRRIRHAACASN